MAPKPQDLTGQTFGRLRVDGLDSATPHRRRWLCRCSCGSTCTAYGSELKTGKKWSCGCATREARSKDLVGCTFGGLLVLGLDQNGANQRVRTWRVRASCGHERTIEEARLQSNPPNNCGALACRVQLLVVGERAVTREALARELGCSDSAISARLKAGWSVDEVVAGHRSGKILQEAIVLGEQYANRRVVAPGRSGEYWSCVCVDCGAASEPTTGNLRKGHGCPCHVSARIAADLQQRFAVGQRFKSFVIVEAPPLGTTSQRGLMLKCRCDCGATFEREAERLGAGTAKSCLCGGRNVRCQLFGRDVTIRQLSELAGVEYSTMRARLKGGRTPQEAIALGAPH